MSTSQGVLEEVAPGAAAAQPVREVLGVAARVDEFHGSLVYCLVGGTTGERTAYAVYTIGEDLSRHEVREVRDAEIGGRYFLVDGWTYSGLYLSGDGELRPWQSDPDGLWFGAVSHDCVVINEDECRPRVQLTTSEPARQSVDDFLAITCRFLTNSVSVGVSRLVRRELALLAPDAPETGDRTVALPLWLVREFNRLLSDESLGTPDRGIYIRSREETERLVATLTALRLVACGYVNRLLR